MGQPLPLFFVYFGLYKQKSLQFFTTNVCKKMSIQKMVWDSNPQLSERESPPETRAFIVPK